MMAVGNSYVPKEGNPAVEVDWYGMEEPWTLEHNAYLAQPEGNPIDVARRVIKD